MIKIDEKGRIDLSLKKVEERPLIQAPSSREDKDGFEKKMMASFLKTSEAKIADLNSKMNASKGRKKPGGRSKG